MKHILYYIGRFFGFFTSELLSLKLRAAFLRFKTGMQAGRFAAFGNNSIIGRHVLLRGCRYITVGQNVNIGDNTILNAWDRFNDQEFTPEIIISDNCHIGQGCHITAINKIHIGCNVLFGKNILITDNSHGSTEQHYTNPPAQRPLTSKGPVIIEDNVWIGSNVCIMPGVTIGANAVIAAGSVVTHNVQPNTVVAGIPAKPIR